VPGLEEFIVVDDNEASDAGSPRFEGDTCAETPAATSSGVGTAPMEDVEVEDLEEEDPDVHFKRKRQSGSRRKRVVKKLVATLLLLLQRANHLQCLLLLLH